MPDKTAAADFIESVIAHTKELGHKVISFSPSGAIEFEGIFARVRKDNSETQTWYFPVSENLSHTVIDVPGFGAVTADQYVLED